MKEEKFCACGEYPHKGKCDPRKLRQHQKWVNEYLIPSNKKLDEYHTVPHLEMEVTVKFKMLVKADYPTDPDGRYRAEHYARYLFSDKEPVSHVEVTGINIGELNEVDKIALPFYLRMEGWSIKHLKIWNIVYATSNNADRILRVKDVDITKLLGIMVKPLTSDTAKIRCMCLGGEFSGPPLDIDTTLDRCPEDVYKAMQEHTCQPWPG